LAAHLKKVRLNRDWGWTANRLGRFALTPEAVEHVYSNVCKPDLVREGRSNLIP
jgi:amidase